MAEENRKFGAPREDKSMALPTQIATKTHVAVDSASSYDER